MFMPMCKPLGSIMLATVLLAGCGGERGPDDGSTGTPITPPDTTNTAQGLWEGATSSGRSIFGLVVGDGSYYLLYTALSNSSSFGGVIQGSGNTSNNTFQSSNAKDFSLESLATANATVTATAAAKSTFNGSIVYGNTTVTFTSRYVADYETTATLSRISGSYVGDASIADAIYDDSSSFTLSSTGTMTGSIGGCTFNGTVTPRTDSNAYNLTIAISTTTGACQNAGQQLSGLAYLNASTGVLYAVLPNPARTAVVIFIMAKSGT